MSTIKDVAKLAGVSTSTVSRALSGKVVVSAGTKKKVLDAARELNFKPNIAAIGLRTGNYKIITVVVPDINNLFTPVIVKRLEEAATRRGYLLVLFNSNDSVEQEKQLLDSASFNSVAAIICMSASDDIEHLVRFQQERGIPVLLLNRRSNGWLNSISVDDVHGGYLMTKYLLERGHKKIAAFTGDFEKLRFRSRYSGYKKAMEEFGVQDFKKYVIYDAITLDEIEQRTITLLSQDDPPTAIFAGTDMMTLGVYRGAYKCGLRIPDDLSIVGFDNLFVTAHMFPALTTYNVPVNKIADICFEMLMRCLEGDQKVSEIILQGDLMVRESVDAPRTDEKQITPFSAMRFSQ